MLARDLLGHSSSLLRHACRVLAGDVSACRVLAGDLLDHSPGSGLVMEIITACFGMGGKDDPCFGLRAAG